MLNILEQGWTHIHKDMNAMLSKIKSEFNDDCKSRIFWKLEKNRTKGKREKKNQSVGDRYYTSTHARSLNQQN
jgi:hypothetical protein